jgi:hypothetical protein
MVNCNGSSGFHSTWHFRYGRSENVFGQREVLDPVRRSLKHSTCLLSPARCEGIEVGNRAHAPTNSRQYNGPGRSLTLGPPALKPAFAPPIWRGLFLWAKREPRSSSVPGRPREVRGPSPVTEVTVEILRRLLLVRTETAMTRLTWPEYFEQTLRVQLQSLAARLASGRELIERCALSPPTTNEFCSTTIPPNTVLLRPRKKNPNPRLPAIWLCLVSIASLPARRGARTSRAWGSVEVSHQTTSKKPEWHRGGCSAARPVRHLRRLTPAASQSC